jgi:recombinational DNA repair protein (RecF pathway)
VKLGGWLPALDRCARCGKAMGSGDAAYFSPRSSAMACAQCRRPGARGVSPETFAAARKMLSERLEQLHGESDAEGVGVRAARELTELMLDVIEHQIDRKLSSRELLESPA